MSETIRDKANHVRQSMSKPQPRNHACHWPGCLRQCRPTQFACTEHWYKIPPSMRHEIWAAYRIGQEEDGKPSAKYLAVVRKVQDWIRGQGV